MRKKPDPDEADRVDLESSTLGSSVFTPEPFLELLPKRKNNRRWCQQSISIFIIGALKITVKRPEVGAAGCDHDD